MNLTTHATNRRTFLRNGAKALTMPFLASLLPAGSRALQNTASGAPNRSLDGDGARPHGEAFLPDGEGRLRRWPCLRPSADEEEPRPGHDGFESLPENKQPHEGSEAVLSCVNVVGFPARHGTTAFPVTRSRQLTSVRKHAMRVCSSIVKTTIPAMATVGSPFLP